MAISHIVSGGINGTNGDIPAGYAIGDLIIIIALRDDGTDPGMSGQGFEEVAPPAGFANLRWRIGFKYAEASSGLTTGNWAGAVRLSIHVYRDAMINGANFKYKGGVDGAAIYDALSNASSTSWMLAWVGSANNDNTNLSTPPTGFTLRTNGTGSGSNRRIVSFDSNGPLQTFAGQSISKGGTNGGWRTIIVELTEVAANGTLNFTETDDTVSQSTTVIDSIATINSQNRSNTFSAVVAPARIGTLNFTQGDDTATTSGYQQRNATLNFTQGNDTVGLSATVIDSIATINSQNRDDALTVTVEVALVGTLNFTQDNDTVSSSSEMGRIATLNFTEAVDALAANSYADAIATINSQNRDDTMAATVSVARVGTLNFTQGSDTLTANSYADSLATINSQNRDDTMAATVSVARVGTLNFTQGDDTATTSGYQQRNATLNFTQGNDTVGLSATVIDSIATINSQNRDDALTVTVEVALVGTLNFTQDNDTVSSSSEMGRIATLNFTEAVDALAANSYADAIATINSQNRDDTLTTDVEVFVKGTLNFTQTNDLLNATLLANRAGTLNFTQESDTASGAIQKERLATLIWEQQDDAFTSTGNLLVQGSLFWREDDEYITSGFDPDETPRRPDECRPIEEMVEEEIDKILTQYRESPNLLFVIRSALMAAGEAWDHLCDLPEYFDIDTAVGDQLTIIGKRMGFPRCHCICEPPAFFGFKCAEDNGNPLTSIVGFCETGVWAACGTSGITEVCIDDDEIYRKFLYVRRYQMLQRYDYESLKTAVQTLWGEKAKVISYGDGRVVIAPFRVLTETEKRLIKLIPRVMPVALGIRVLIHFSTYPKVAGFGEGWGGFCEEIPGEIIYTDTEGDRYMITENGIEYLAADEYTRDAYWLCPVDVKPYSC